MTSRLASVLIVAAMAAPVPASADVFKLFGEAHGGGMYGKGTAGAQQSADFFEQSPHGAYGVLVGGEFLFFDGWIQHHQFTDGSRLTTWTQFGLGVHFTLDMGTPEERKAHNNAYMEFGSGLWFGVGTGQQVM